MYTLPKYMHLIFLSHTNNCCFAYNTTQLVNTYTHKYIYIYTYAETLHKFISLQI